MFDLFAGLLAFCYDIWPSYGGAIVLFTLIIMVVLSPLSIKSARSAIALQRLQPELKRLQEKYKDDREALNRETMAFYSANNINPFTSCLPVLLQLPVFMILYRVLEGLTHKGSDGNFDPKYLNESTSLYKSLSATDEMLSWGMDLSRSALKELSAAGMLAATPYFVLVGLVALTGWYQQRQITGRSPQSGSAQQQAIMKFLPFVFVPISLSIPAGVVIYFVSSNLVRVAQQAWVTYIEFGRPAKKQGGGSNGASGKPESTALEKGLVEDPPPSNGSNGSSASPRPARRKRRKK